MATELGRTTNKQKSVGFICMTGSIPFAISFPQKDNRDAFVKSMSKCCVCGCQSILAFNRLNLLQPQTNGMSNDQHE